MDNERAHNFLGLLCYGIFMDNLGHKRFKPFKDLSERKRQAWIKTAVELQDWIARFYEGEFHDDK